MIKHKQLTWLTKEFLEQRYTYDPTTGVVTSKYTGRPIKDKRGRDNTYYRISIMRKGKRHSLAAHVVAFTLMTGKLPDKSIDHINGDGLDNRWNNLREASAYQQALNVRIRSDNSSGYRGVSWERCSKKYKAYIYIKGRSKHIGRFTCKHDAAEAYNRMAIKYFDPEFRQLNIIQREG